MDPGVVDPDVSVWICLASAVVLSGALFLELRSVLRLRSEGLRAEGTVIDNVEKTSERSKKRWVPVIAFTDAEGYGVEFAPRAHSGKSMPVGSTVPVVYLRDKPAAARRNSWGDLWLLTHLLAVLLAGNWWAVIALTAQLMTRGGV